MKKPTCFECDAELEQTGRNTWYCPDCNVCAECGCPDADGFMHYANCNEIGEHDEQAG